MTEGSFRCAAILLAAGNSSRMGMPKQLLQIEGKTLLRRTVETIAATSLSPIAVVVGANESIVSPDLASLPVIITTNPEWQRGMASSIQAGLKALQSVAPALEAVVISVCDQPLLRSDHFTQLISAHYSSGKKIATMRYAGVDGPPVLFEAAFFKSLLNLDSPKGAKEILMQNSHEVVAVDAPELAVDLDTPEDFRNFLAGHISRSQ